MRATPSVLPLHVRGVSYVVDGKALLSDIDFTLTDGSRTIMLGPNGAGKSLTLRLCHGLLQPSTGEISWAVPHRVAARAQAMVFQRPVMLRRSAAANVAYALAVRGVPRRRRGPRVAEALAAAGLADRAATPARVLSAGQQQRLALARAWALEPEVLFLDEPTANLDPAATHAIERVINAFRGRGTKIVMTTHDLGQARRLADHVLFLHRGRLVEQGPAEAFFSRPASREARSFIKGELLW